jgi:hypothetical protein
MTITAVIPDRRHTDESVLERLVGSRPNEVIFVAHCILDENVRYLDGASHGGAVPDAARLVASGIGVCQMSCPEVRAWGGVRKSRMVRAYGLRDTRVYPFRRPLFTLFLWSTRLRCRQLIREVVRDIERYRDGRVEVIALVGVGALLLCGMRTTLGLDRSFETVAGCPLAKIDRALMSESAVAGYRVAGAGLFMTGGRKRFTRRRIHVPATVYDLIAEMRGIDHRLDLNIGAVGTHGRRS